MDSRRTSDIDPPAPADAVHAALCAAMDAVLAPLARLAVAHGLVWSEAEDRFRQAFVDAALAAHPDVTPGRAVSRVAAATGINRREVTRLLQPAARPAASRPSPASQVFTRWLAAADVLPASLPRQGPAPSFEVLAQSVTRDVHPRSLLEELVRLGLVAVEAGGERVRLARRSFVPSGDRDRMLAFLGANVGGHLAGAVANVLADGRQHFEQALFADELSEQSLAEVRALITGQWQALMQALAPRLEALIEADRQSGRPADRRIRIGLYSFSEAGPDAAATAAAGPARSPQEP